FVHRSRGPGPAPENRRAGLEYAASAGRAVESGVEGGLVLRGVVPEAVLAATQSSKFKVQSSSSLATASAIRGAHQSQAGEKAFSRHAFLWPEARTPTGIARPVR